MLLYVAVRCGPYATNPCVDGAHEFRTVSVYRYYGRGLGGGSSSISSCAVLVVQLVVEVVVVWRRYEKTRGERRGRARDQSIVVARCVVVGTRYYCYYTTRKP